MIEKYTIYCTAEQTNKALELGAPIDYKEIPTEYKEEPFSYRTILLYHKETICPTAEQMICWLEDKCNVINFIVGRDMDYTEDYGFTSMYYYSVFFEDNRKRHKCTGSKFGTKKEAVLAGIDAALDYLMERKF